MAMPLMPEAADSGCRRRWTRCAALALLVVVVLAIAPCGGFADDADPFAATVAVDATAESAAAAREQARIDGQRRAVTAVAEHLLSGSVPANAAAKLAKLDDKTITDLVANFEVAHERMSAVRYSADYTFHFRPNETRRVLRAAGVAAAGENPARPAVLLPVLQTEGQPRLWDDPNPWRDAWSQHPSTGSAQRLAVPLGDVGDLAAIDGQKAQAGDAQALAAIARRNGAEDALVAIAALRGSPGKPSGIDVTARRYHAGKLVASRVEPLAANPGEGEEGLLRRAVAAVIAGLDSGWKKEAAPGVDQLGSLTAVLPVSSLDDWVHARERLAAVPAIRSVGLVALSRQEATIEIRYGGSIEQLKTALAEANLDLVKTDSAWRLARDGSGRKP